MKIRTLLVVALSVATFGCGGSKKAQQAQVAPQPDWVKARVSSPIYYYGIGAARKTFDVSQYQQAARQNALADMASEISISISSNSVLHAFESNLNFREDFTSTIRAQAQQDLEGYELVDTWDDLENYWVFYRLSKAQHQELKERRKNDAATRSLDFFTSGINSRGNGDIRIAMVQLIKALEPIKPYFSEPLPVEFNGQQIFLGNEIFKELSATLSQIEVVAQGDNISVKTGQRVTSDNLQFKTEFRRQGLVSGIPLVASYSERPIRNNKQRSSTAGLATFEIDLVRSIKSSETFTATFDIDDVLAEAGADPFIRKLVGRFTLPQGVIRLNISKPSFAIISREILLGEVLQPGYIEESFRKKAVEAGYVIKGEPSSADYTVRISAIANRRDDSGQFKNVSIEGVLSVEDSNGKSIYHLPLSGFSGRHFEHKQAGKEAFKEAQRRFEVTYFREIQEAISRR